MEQTTTTLFTFCKKVVDLFMNWAHTVIDTLNSPLSDVLNVVHDIPFIGNLVQPVTDTIVWIITASTGSADVEITLLEFMFGSGFAIFIAVSFVIWVLNIIT